MKFKLITIILEVLLFSVSLAGIIMMLMKIQLPTTMVSIMTILLVITSMSEFMKTRKFIKLGYPLIIIYSLVAMPIIANFIDNLVLSYCFVALSFVIIMLFLYSELILSNNEKN